MNTLFFIETIGLSHKYGIGSYRKNILPEVASTGRFETLYLVQVGIAPTDIVEVAKGDNNIVTISIYFQTPSFSAIGEADFQIDTEMARKCFAILSEKTKCRKGIVHINMAGQFGLAKVFREHHFPVVYTHHFSTVKYNQEHNEYLAAYIEAERNVFELADQVIFLSEATKRLATKFYNLDKEKVCLVKNGIRLQQAKLKKNEKTVIKKRLGFKDRDYIFLFVGRVTREKGIYELLHAFSILSEQAPHIHMVVAGDGDFEGVFRISSKRPANIHFTGFLPANRLQDLYCIADAGILPSYAEQSSYALLELVSYHIPLIVSDIDSFRGFRNKADLLKVKVVKQEAEVVGIDLPSLYTGMASLFQDRAMGHRLSKNAMALISRDHSAAVMTGNTIAAYDHAVAVSGNKG